MKRNFSAYPQKWGLHAPDANIDHRRVPNLMTYFTRKGYAQPIGTSADSYAAGDIVTWDLGRGVTHIGIVSDRRTAKGTAAHPSQQSAAGVQEEEALFQYRILGHYRLK